jgi:hypothetical protein
MPFKEADSKHLQCCPLGKQSLGERKDTPSSIQGTTITDQGMQLQAVDICSQLTRPQG